MKMFKTTLEKRIARKFNEIESKIRTSFSQIRKEINNMDKKMQDMQNTMQNKETQDRYARKKDNKLRADFRKQVDEFSQKISQLNISLQEVKALKNQIVITKDLAKIEENIKTGFREQLEVLKNKINDCEKTIKQQDKKIEQLEKFKQKTKNHNNKSILSRLRKNKNLPKKK